MSYPGQGHYSYGGEYGNYSPPPGPPPQGYNYGPPSGPPPQRYGYGPPTGPRPQQQYGYGPPTGPRPQPRHGDGGPPPGPPFGAAYGSPTSSPPTAPQVIGNGISYQYSNCTGRRKALCIGINYFGSKNELKGCINGKIENMIFAGRFKLMKLS